MATSIENAELKFTHASILRKFWRYIVFIVLAILLLSGLLMSYALIGYGRFASLTYGYNPFAPIVPDGDPNWYRDYGGRYVPEIQDEELFYHNIGGSVAAAKMADIVVLGPSFVAYAFDRATMRRFGLEHGLKLYNMSFIGIRGGEFSLGVIEQWNIQAKLWVINVDDQFIHFFSHGMDLTLGPNTQVIPATLHGRLRGFVNVIGQNLRWRVEDRHAGSQGGGIARNVRNGNVFLDSNPRYVATDNKDIKFDRDHPQDCHASKQTIAIAKDYFHRIGGQVVFTLVPHSQACPQQARELAKAVGVELIIPPFKGFSSVDGGGHLDKKSAAKFSEYFFASLLKSKAFTGMTTKHRGVGIDKSVK